MSGFSPCCFLFSAIYSFAAAKAGFKIGHWRHD